jgi:hypothetical protein
MMNQPGVFRTVTQHQQKLGVRERTSNIYLVLFNGPAVVLFDFSLNFNRVFLFILPFRNMADPENVDVVDRPVIHKAISFPMRTTQSRAHVGFANHDVNYAHFAGRLGGNQLFTLTTDDPQYEQTKERIPDAVVASSWREIIDLGAFKERRLWEMAVIEGIGVSTQVFCSGIVGQALVSYATVLSTGPLVPVSLAAVVQFLMISLFTFALGPVTGAHLNPLITMATFVVRLSSFARTVLYVIFQCVCVYVLHIN